MLNSRSARAIAGFWLLSTSALLRSEAPAYPSARVSHIDLDLNLDSDRRRLGLRVREAVEHVCGYASAADPLGQNAVRRCNKETSHNAARQIDDVISRASSPHQAAK
jgi:UrcA family protein